MKTICCLIFAFTLLCGLPTLAADEPATSEAVDSAVIDTSEVPATAEVLGAETALETLTTVEILATRAPESCAGARRLASSLFDGQSTLPSWGCVQCCAGCDDVSSRIPCDEWCGCSCDDANEP